MIVRENGVFFTLIRQNDHALLSGEMASHWGNKTFAKPSNKLVLTTSLHDLSWIDSDASLHWNESRNTPYDFTNLPFVRRLPMYKKGLDFTEKLHPYGGLLTSLHYSSFLKEGEDLNADRFLHVEKTRQEKLRDNFFEDPIENDLQQLQMFDRLSLYVCLNEPGTPKEKEHHWYKNGIQTTDKEGNPVTISLRWLNERTVTLNPFPFSESWSTTLSYSMVRKSLGSNDPDFNKVYNQHIRFVPT
ncbi:MAG TPA: DUF3891 family protein [Bacillales bacterium]|nr:DUF3891 family protein [Bacillales bacterium]